MCTLVCTIVCSLLHTTHVCVQPHTCLLKVQLAAPEHTPMCVHVWGWSNIRTISSSHTCAHLCAHNIRRIHTHTCVRCVKHISLCTLVCTIVCSLLHTTHVCVQPHTCLLKVQLAAPEHTPMCVHVWGWSNIRTISSSHTCAHLCAHNIRRMS